MRLSTMRRNGVAFVLAAVALAITASAKIAVLLRGDRYLYDADPVVWFMTKGGVLWLGVGLELTTASMLLTGKRLLLRAGTLVVMCNLLLGYRFLKHLLGDEGACMCFGALTQLFRIQAPVADWASLGLLGHLATVEYLGFWSALKANPVA